MLKRFLDRNPGKIAIVAAGVGRGGTIAAGEFLIDPAPLAQVVHRGHASPGKKNKKYGVRAKQRDHRQPSWHTQAGTPKLAHARWHTQDGSQPGLVVFPGVRPYPLFGR